MCDLKENPTKEEEEDRNDGRLFMQWLCDTTGSLKTRRGLLNANCCQTVFSLISAGIEFALACQSRRLKNFD